MKPKTVVSSERSLLDIYGTLCAGPVNELQNWGQAEETTRGGRLGKLGQVVCLYEHPCEGELRWGKPLPAPC